MVTGFYNVSISTENTEDLVKFYRDIIGVPLQFEGFFDTYDGAMLGFDPKGPMLCIWDRTRWGQLSVKVTFLLKVDNLEKTYQELKTHGLEIEPPRTAKWGGEILLMNDPEGNQIVMLDQKAAWHYRGEGSRQMFGED